MPQQPAININSLLRTSVQKHKEAGQNLDQLHQLSQIITEMVYVALHPQEATYIQQCNNYKSENISLDVAGHLKNSPWKLVHQINSEQTNSSGAESFLIGCVIVQHNSYTTELSKKEELYSTVYTLKD